MPTHTFVHSHAISKLAIWIGCSAFSCLAPSPCVVPERLGHATVSFTLDTYSHVLPGLQEDAAAKVAALIAAPTP